MTDPDIESRISFCQRVYDTPFDHFNVMVICLAVVIVVAITLTLLITHAARGRFR